MSQNEYYQVKNEVTGLYEMYDKANFLVKTKKTGGPYKGVLIKEKTDVLESKEEITHSITEEDLENNPSLLDEGVKVGDEIEISETTESETTESEKESNSDKMKSKNANKFVIETIEISDLENSCHEQSEDLRTISEWCQEEGVELLTDEGFSTLTKKEIKTLRISKEDWQSGISRCSVKNIL
jgi:hypothetical protein